jgi:hypothetical protein
MGEITQLELKSRSKWRFKEMKTTHILATQTTTLANPAL